MTMIHHILTATDFSPRAVYAVRRAALLAKAHGATLHLVHVMNKLLLQMLEWIPHEGPDTHDRLLAAAEAQLGEITATLGRHFGIEVRTQVLAGRVRAVDSAFETIFDRQRDVTAVIDVSMSKHHSIDRSGIKGQRLPVFQA